MPLSNNLQGISDRDNVWSKMIAFASISTKTSVMILVVSVIRDDWMMGVAGVLILSVGNAALMLLAQTLRRMHFLQVDH